jgi:hypothetical protein
MAPAFVFSNGEENSGTEVLMGVFILYMVLAFILFAVILPLAGFAIGWFCYYVMPYVFGGVVVLLLSMVAGLQLIFSWWIWIVGFVWASAVYLMKVKFRELGDEVEHYRAAHATLLGGFTYRRRKNQIAVALAGES